MRQQAEIRSHRFLELEAALQQGRRLAIRMLRPLRVERGRFGRPPLDDTIFLVFSLELDLLPRRLGLEPLGVALVGDDHRSRFFRRHFLSWEAQ